MLVGVAVGVMVGVFVGVGVGIVVGVGVGVVVGAALEADSLITPKTVKWLIEKVIVFVSGFTVPLTYSHCPVASL